LRKAIKTKYPPRSEGQAASKPRFGVANGLELSLDAIASMKHLAPCFGLGNLAISSFNSHNFGPALLICIGCDAAVDSLIRLPRNCIPLILLMKSSVFAVPIAAVHSFFRVFRRLGGAIANPFQKGLEAAAPAIGIGARCLTDSTKNSEPLHLTYRTPTAQAEIAKARIQ